MEFQDWTYYFNTLTKDKKDIFLEIYDLCRGEGYTKEDSFEITRTFVDGLGSNEGNKKIKYYNNGFFKWEEATNDIYHKQAVPRLKMWWEYEEEEEYISEVQHKSAEEKKYLASRRAKERVFDIVMLNTWKYFVTLTIDPKENDSSDVALVRKKLRNWLNNMQKRKGLEYVLIPEYHKDGEKIHAHLLINDSNLTFVDSGNVSVPGFSKPIKIETANKYGIPLDQRKTVYNIPEWKYGWTTAIKYYGANNLRAAIYITKYITKDSDLIFGKYFWSSKGITRTPFTIIGPADCNWFNIYYDKDSVYLPGTETKIRYGTNIGYTMGKTDLNEEIKSLEEEAKNKTEYEYFASCYGLQEKLHFEEIKANDDSWLLCES